MKFSLLAIPILAAPIYGFFLSPPCLSAFNKLLGQTDNFQNDLQERICAKGCVFSAQTYEEISRDTHARPALKKVLTEYLGRVDNTDEDIEQLLQISDAVAELSLEVCYKADADHIPKHEGIASSKAGDADLCEEPSRMKDCSDKMKAQILRLMWEYRSQLLSFTDDNTCKQLSQALDKPGFRHVFEEMMDNYASSCPTRG
ncbi:hypothetical protein BDV39DRAFT_181648 [Aspergillus sergii]|uniref:Uncharacterized protein n=1 Tax=Aspergillus sergii TaxID=1034303 RepID=A0A5N6WVG8_9EURO|nr:hypothetical protein BDV39DRAFT_181648 [Aspergillus sergii]